MNGTSTSSLDLAAFRAWADRVLAERGVGAELVRVSGRRWGHLAGPEAPLPLAAPQRILLGEDLGLILYGTPCPQEGEERRRWEEEALQALGGLGSETELLP